jgi:GDP-L-fucose synthase
VKWFGCLFFDYDTFLNIFSVDEAAEVSIAEISQMVADAFELEQGIVLDETKADGQFKKTASNLKLRKYLPDFQFTPLPEAVRESVKWFVENYEVARK